MKEPEFDQSIIIDRPDLKTRTRLYMEWGATVVGWILWFFLVRPFILLLAWVVGYKLFYIHMFKYKGIENLDLFLKYGCAILVIYFVMQAWNLYNARRFRGKDRRTSPRFASDSEMAEFFEMSVEEVEGLKRSARVEVDFMENNQLVCRGDQLDHAARACYDPQNLADKVHQFKR